MKTIICNQHERVAKWVKERIGGQLEWGNITTLGLERDGELIAGVVYSGYLPGARISMSCAGGGKRWLNRAFLHAAFDYPFNQLGVRVIVNTVDSSNLDSVRFTEHIGFKEVGTVEQGFGDTDLIIFKMHRRDCRWVDMEERLTC